jgi:hypothetical protein
MSIIKAGYRITVTSWENDADNYNTKTVEGLNEDEVNFHIDLLKLIVGSNSNDKTVFGNMYDPRDSELEAFREAVIRVFLKHSRPDSIYEPLNIAMDIIGEYTGYGGDGFYTRVAESIVVEFVPQEIIIEDVSTKFGV